LRDLFVFSALVLVRRYGDGARAYFVEVVQNGIDAVSRGDPQGTSPTASLRQLGLWHAILGRSHKRQRTGKEGQDVVMRANGNAATSPHSGEASGAGAAATTQLATYLRHQVTCFQIV
jgi:hypothetical protein